MNNKEIQFRELKKEDFPQVKELLYQTWIKKDYGDDKKIADKMSIIFMYELLVRHSFSKVAIHEHRIVGIILGRINKDFNLKENLNYLTKMFFNSLSLILTNNGRKAIKEGIQVNKVNNKLLDKVKDNTDGELVLFAINKQTKGKGIGKKLLGYFYKYMEKEKANNFYLFTDTSCDYEFYDYNGFTREEEEKIYFKKEVETYYIYTKNIK